MDLKLALKKSTRILLRKRYHYISNSNAHKVLRGIEKNSGKLSLTLKKQADDYAKDVLGWKGYAPWLYVYSAIQEEFKEGWVPDNFYRDKVIDAIQGDYGKVSFLKPLSNRVFSASLGPDIASYINGHWFDSSLQAIDKQKISSLLFARTSKIVIKLDQSYQGRGIFVLEASQFNINHVEAMGNFVVQHYIQQHNFFNGLVEGSVATIRLTSVIDKQHLISLRSAYLRLGRNTDKYVKSESHIRVPINSTSGALAQTGYFANWKVTEEHPDSKSTFLGKHIPNFQDCVERVKQLHSTMPMVGAIGWDVVVDAQGLTQIMEWNGYSNDIKFSEATQGPCFKDLNWEALR